MLSCFAFWLSIETLAVFWKIVRPFASAFEYNLNETPRRHARINPCHAAQTRSWRYNAANVDSGSSADSSDRDVAYGVATTRTYTHGVFSGTGNIHINVCVKYMYARICVYVCVYTYVHMFAFKVITSKQRQARKEGCNNCKQKQSDFMHTYLNVYIYMYIQVFMYVCMCVCL